MSQYPFYRTVYLFALCLNLAGHALAGMLEDGEDFSNNLASDIAPLLSLFGEQVTTQFMSQSTGWADCILLSMAPIGVVTILVSAIRVGGPRWLKAIVGRVRENMVASELEIMSSTSEESCELWNGQGVVKCQGASSIREFICIYSPSAPDGTPVNEIGQIKSVRIMDIDTATVSRENPTGYLIMRERDPGVDKSTDQPKHLAKAPARVGTCVRRRGGQDLESGNANLPAPGEIVIVHNRGHPAPNISLNCQADGHRQRVWAYAVLSVVLQAGVLIYFGFVTEYPTLRFEKDGQPVEPYAMPLAVAGTVLLGAGMLICSDVVNKSTTEKIRQVDRTCCGISHVWLQQEKRVSDQLFRSAAIYPGGKHVSYENMTSGRRSNAKGPSQHENRGALPVGTWTTIGAFASVLGVGAQFTGLRGMHWTASIAQLGAVILTVVLRAVVRLHLAPRIEHKSLTPGFELEWSVTSLVKNHPDSPWLPRREQKSHSHKHVRPLSPSSSVSHVKAAHDTNNWEGSRKSSQPPFIIQTWNSRFKLKPEPDPESTISSTKGSAPNSSNSNLEPYNEVVSGIQTAQGMLDLRLHMGRLGKWESPVSTQAKILHRAVEETLGFFRSNFKDCFKDCHFHSLVAIGAGAGKITFNIEPSDGQGLRASFDELDAALSMWVYSMEHHRHDSGLIDDTSSQSPHPGKHESAASCQYVQVLGPATEAMDRDLSLWLPTGMVEDQKWKETAGEEIHRTKTRNVGRSGQWHRTENKDRVVTGQNKISPPRSPVSSHHSQPSQVDTENNDDETSTKQHKDTWLTVSSQEQPEKFYAKDIFSSFVWALAQYVTHSRCPEQLGASVQASDLDGQDAAKLKNRELSSLVQRITNLGSWTRRDVYLCLIPALSSFGILPGARPIIERTVDLGVALEKSQKWDHACDEYDKLRLVSDELPAGSHARWKSLAILASFDARLGKPGTRRFGSQRDDAYESDEVSDVRNRIQDIFAEEDKRLEKEMQKRGENGQADVRGILEDALRIYDTFPSSSVALQRICLWDPSKEVWRGKIGGDQGGPARNTKEYPLKRVTSTFDRDIFDRTPFHHAMRSNAPTESQSLPKCDLEDLEEQLRSKAEELSRKTDRQVIWSEDSLLALLDPAKKSAELMDSTADPKALDFNHWTPLHYACHIVLPRVSSHPQETKPLEKDPDLKKLQDKLRLTYHKRAVRKARALIERKVDVNASGLDGTTPLHCAAASGCEELVDLLVRHRANINAQKNDGTTPLHCATMSGCVGLVKYLLRHQAVETVGSDGRTLLHLAAMTGNSAVFSWLKTTAEVKDQAGRTPLHLAAMSRATSSIRELVDLGANRDAKDHRGRTPLHLACVYNRPGSVKELLNLKQKKKRLVYVDPNAKDDHGRTALHLAALFNSKEAVEALLTFNVDFSSKDVEGRCPLHLAALSGALDALPLLIVQDKGLSERWPPLDDDSQTPFHLAASKGNKVAIKMMAESMMGDDLAARKDTVLRKSKSDDLTAFGAAAQNGHVSSMQAIIDLEKEKGASHAEDLKKRLLKSTNANGDTPFMDARRKRNWDVCWALIDMADGLGTGDLTGDLWA